MNNLGGVYYKKPCVACVFIKNKAVDNMKVIPTRVLVFALLSSLLSFHRFGVGDVVGYVVASFWY
jgi:hypothetical protein